VYKIDPDGLGEFEVYCDQNTAGGGWTVFQKRYDGSVDFFRGWENYKRGFGNLNGEFWLGLDKIHRLTVNSSNQLRTDLEDVHGRTAYAGKITEGPEGGYQSHFPAQFFPKSHFPVFKSHSP